MLGWILQCSVTSSDAHQTSSHQQKSFVFYSTSLEEVPGLFLCQLRCCESVRRKQWVWVLRRVIFPQCVLLFIFYVNLLNSIVEEWHGRHNETSCSIISSSDTPRKSAFCSDPSELYTFILLLSGDSRSVTVPDDTPQDVTAISTCLAGFVFTSHVEPKLFFPSSSFCSHVTVTKAKGQSSAKLQQYSDVSSPESCSLQIILEMTPTEEPRRRGRLFRWQIKWNKTARPVCVCVCVCACACQRRTLTHII